VIAFGYFLEVRFILSSDRRPRFLFLFSASRTFWPLSRGQPETPATDDSCPRPGRNTCATCASSLSGGQNAEGPTSHSGGRSLIFQSTRDDVKCRQRFTMNPHRTFTWSSNRQRTHRLAATYNPSGEEVLVHRPTGPDAQCPTPARTSPKRICLGRCIRVMGHLHCQSPGKFESQATSRKHRGVRRRRPRLRRTEKELSSTSCATGSRISSMTTTAKHVNNFTPRSWDNDGGPLLLARPKVGLLLSRRSPTE